MRLYGGFTEGTAMDLERLIDSQTIQQFLNQVSEICDQKSEHVAHAWQDTLTAKRWSKLARVLDALAADLGAL